MVRAQLPSYHAVYACALFVAFCVAGTCRVDAYRLGDSVDTDIRFYTKIAFATGPAADDDEGAVGTQSHHSHMNDVLRSQTPLFGIDSEVQFALSTGSFSLLFEEGLWGLPSIPMEGKGEGSQYLQSWQINFVYTKPTGSSATSAVGVGGDDGAIHAVTYGEPVYGEYQGDSFTVRYKWIREESVDVESERLVMFLSVVIASVLIIISSCSGAGDERSDQSYDSDGHRRMHFGSATTVPQQPSPNNGSSMPASVPKWD